MKRDPLSYRYVKINPFKTPISTINSIRDFQRFSLALNDFFHLKKCRRSILNIACTPPLYWRWLLLFCTDRHQLTFFHPLSSLLECCSVRFYCCHYWVWSRSFRWWTPSTLDCNGILLCLAKRRLLFRFQSAIPENLFVRETTTKPTMSLHINVYTKPYQPKYWILLI